MATEEQLEARRKWVAALRSGEYKQGFGRLQDHDSYCCLGVACRTYGMTGHLKNATLWEEAQPVADALGLTGGDGCFSAEVDAAISMKALAYLNDDARWTFDQIADFIESNPAGLFKD